MSIIRARFKKTVQEVQYEPFDAEVEVEMDTGEDSLPTKKKIQQILNRAEEVVDEKMAERLNAIEEE